jgi:hypothetical protein
MPAKPDSLIAEGHQIYEWDRPNGFLINFAWVILLLRLIYYLLSLRPTGLAVSKTDIELLITVFVATCTWCS